MLKQQAYEELQISNKILTQLKNVNNYRALEKYLPILTINLCDDFNIDNFDIENIEMCKSVAGFNNIKKFKENYKNKDFIKNYTSINFKNAGNDLLEEINNKLKQSNEIMLINYFKLINNKLIDLCENCIFKLCDNNIIHTDIKRENLTIDKNQQISLIDFGRAIIANGNEIPSVVYLYRLDFNILPSLIIFNYLEKNNNLTNITNKLDFILNNHIDNPNTIKLIEDLQIILNMNKEDIIKLIVNLSKNVIQEKNLFVKENLKNIVMMFIFII